MARTAVDAIAALLDLTCVSDGERHRIGLIVREIADLMEALRTRDADGSATVRLRR